MVNKNKIGYKVETWRMTETPSIVDPNTTNVMVRFGGRDIVEELEPLLIRKAVDDFWLMVGEDDAILVNRAMVDAWNFDHKTDKVTLYINNFAGPYLLGQLSRAMLRNSYKALDEERTEIYRD